MLLQGQVGPVSAGDGTYPNIRTGKLGDAIVSELNGRYYENAYRGNTFTASNSAAAVFSAVATAATGYILSNPAGSGKNLVILDIEFQYTVAVAGATQALLYANINPIAAATVHTTPLTVLNTLLGGASGVAKVDSSATLPLAPTAMRVIQAAATTGAAATVLPYVKDEVAGAIVVTPGCTVSIQGTAVIAGGVASMTWAEVAI